MNMDNYPFSKREKEALNLLMQGKSNKQIAITLGISEHTVEFHLKNIYAKLQVSSRVEAILKLGKSTGTPMAGKPGESAVDRDGEKGDNQDDLKKSGQEAGVFFKKYKFLITIGILLTLLLVLVRSKPTSWEKYERECEYPDEVTVGKMISRSNASGSKVHGQFGTIADSPWPAKFGYVIYKNINIPQVDSLYLQLRYSKNSPDSVPILVYIDDETAPRASIYPKDLQNWDQFIWTEPIYLGKINRGVHSIKISTEGQQYGVADLDKLILTSKIP